MKSKIVFGVGLFLLFVAFFFFPQANAEQYPMAPHTQEECVIHAKIGYITALAKEQGHSFKDLAYMFNEHYAKTPDLHAYGTLAEFDAVVALAYAVDGTPEEAAMAIYNRCMSHEDMS